MIEQIKKRCEELNGSYLIIKNQITELEKELQNKKDQLQKITGAIIEFELLIKQNKPNEKKEI